jgi:hypothetical protein
MYTMTPEELKKKLEANPRFVEAKKDGQAFIILGYKSPMQVNRSPDVAPGRPKRQS